MALPPPPPPNPNPIQPFCFICSTNTLANTLNFSSKKSPKMQILYFTFLKYKTVLLDLDIAPYRDPVHL